MITITETKEYTAKKAALCWVLKELGFIVSDIDKFIEDYDDLRIAVCNALTGTSFQTNYAFTSKDDESHNTFARYIMMCDDPFEIINLCKADYIKASVSNTPAIDAAFDKIKDQMQDVPMNKKPDEHVKNMAELTKRRMNLYDPETRLGASRIAIANVIDALVEGKIDYNDFRLQVYSNQPVQKCSCQCGYLAGIGDEHCAMCGSKTDRTTVLSRFRRVIIDHDSANGFINAISRCLNPKTVYTGYDEDVDSIRCILAYNSEYDIDKNTMATINNHIRQYLVGIANYQYETNSVGEITDAYREYTIAKNLDESIESLNKILKLINVKYLIKHDGDIYRVRAWR